MYLLLINQWKLLLFIISVIIEMYLLYFLIFLWNLSVHVFIKLIPLGIIYFEGRACYIGKIS